MTQKTISKSVRTIGFLWGITGVSLILFTAIVRIAPYGLEAIRSSLSIRQWAVLFVWCLYMLITEGYKGFQKQFSPRVVARAMYLLDKPRTVDIILAPLFCMGYFHATKRRLVTTWILTLGIVLFVIIVRKFSQPWRGIIDLGVVLGLIYGLATIYYFLFRAIFRKDFDVDSEVS